MCARLSSQRLPLYFGVTLSSCICCHSTNGSTPHDPLLPDFAAALMSSIFQRDTSCIVGIVRDSQRAYDRIYSKVHLYPLSDSSSLAACLDDQQTRSSSIANISLNIKSML